MTEVDLVFNPDIEYEVVEEVRGREYSSDVMYFECPEYLDGEEIIAVPICLDDTHPSEVIRFDEDGYRYVACLQSFKRTVSYHTVVDCVSFYAPLWCIGQKLLIFRASEEVFSVVKCGRHHFSRAHGVPNVNAQITVPKNFTHKNLVVLPFNQLICDERVHLGEDIYLMDCKEIFYFEDNGVILGLGKDFTDYDCFIVEL